MPAIEKTELMWAGTKYNVASLLRVHDPSLTLGTNTVKVSDAVRVLGDLFTPNLALEKHATTVSAKCFLWPPYVIGGHYIFAL